MRESPATVRAWDELARALVPQRRVRPPLDPMPCPRCGADMRESHVVLDHAGTIVCYACAPLVAEEMSAQ